MKVRKFLIADGNITALVWGSPKNKYLEVSKKLLNEVEQVGFVEKNPNKLVMMGGELCINAALATAYTLDPGENLIIGQNKNIKYEVKSNKASIYIPLDYKLIKPNTVLLEGIGYIFGSSDKEVLEKLSSNYDCPAFGSISLKGNKIYPTVFVRTLRTVVEETACGSGSIAANLLYGLQEIVQPTGSKIIVKNNNGRFKVSAEIKELMYDGGDYGFEYATI